MSDKGRKISEIWRTKGINSKLNLSILCKAYKLPSLL